MLSVIGVDGVSVAEQNVEAPLHWTAVMAETDANFGHDVTGLLHWSHTPPGPGRIVGFPGGDVHSPPTVMQGGRQRSEQPHTQ